MLCEIFCTFDFWRLHRVGTTVRHGHICIIKSHNHPCVWKRHSETTLTQAPVSHVENRKEGSGLTHNGWKLRFACFRHFNTLDQYFIDFNTLKLRESLEGSVLQIRCVRWGMPVVLMLRRLRQDCEFQKVWARAYLQTKQAHFSVFPQKCCPH